MKTKFTLQALVLATLLNTKTPLFALSMQDPFQSLWNADVDKPNQYGLTPLMIAAQKGYPDVVKELLSKGADVNYSIPNTRHIPFFMNTALLIAIESGRTEVAHILIDQGADVNKAREDGWTPLMSAAKNSNLEILNRLLAKEVDVNNVDEYGSTALMQAVQTFSLNPTIVDMLLEKGADVHKKDSLGFTALTLAQIWGDLAGSKNNNYETAIDMILRAVGVQEETPEEIKLSLAPRTGYKKPEKIQEGTQLFHEFFSAVTSGDKKCVKGLIKARADVNEDCFGLTPLSIAVDMGHPDIVQLLIAHGACILKSHLDSAKKLGDEEIIGILENALKDIRRRDFWYSESDILKSPLDSAKELGDEEIIRILENIEKFLEYKGLLR